MCNISDNDGPDFHLMTVTAVTQTVHIRFIWSEMYKLYVTPSKC